jgi:integrase
MSRHRTCSRCRGVIPGVRVAQKILQRQLDARDKAWVFPGPDGVPYSRIHVTRVFRKAARAAGLKDLHFHDLHHHGAPVAVNAGFTAPIVMQLGGWKTEKMMRRYAVVTDQTLRAAAEAVSGNREAPFSRSRVCGARKTDGTAE